ncbi:HRDC domain-containing protein [Arcticibacter tournemirensis]|uniref:ATP-dependent DNA helicase UvrD2 n=1 Tax=Arcticibacter tournemirensis TaxID=699437 RepID=A0A4Q0M466_9SPHI|nr:HRDC domain-containing protein [Arcticibacter tournemirensis]RXF67727.1 ATP-dependent DNA helicase UvrD2 [Arcticibacter tournemirensis]
MSEKLQLAKDYIDQTNSILFLTGKAGTGKTTFLRNLRQYSAKKLAIVAPTGVAAINAGGMTINSFFQIPFGPLLPDTAEQPDIHFSAEKRELLSALELLIIDEISMVRPDVLDRIDLLLRNIKQTKYPFGGVQLLLIGDLSQLSPIIRDEDWSILRRFYATPYFFSSTALTKASFVRIELTEVFRQSDPIFVDILNQVRQQQISEAALAKLNERYTISTEDVNDHIVLTTHNRIVQEINDLRLQELDGELMEYKATIRGEFPPDGQPTDMNLQLKVGAQVMFVKNDNSPEKLYFNGKIGQVVRLTNDSVFVRCGTSELLVQATEWSNIKYKLEDEKIGESLAGSFSQIPLKLAWAITIHKSQGLTFDKAIIDVSEAFAPGQTYVALSRCRSLEGLILRQPVAQRNIITDPHVKQFDAAADSLAPNEITLAKDAELYRQFLLQRLFSFSDLKTAVEKLPALQLALAEDVFEIARKMEQQTASYTPDRIKKAAQYFDGKLRDAIAAAEPQLRVTANNSKNQSQKADAAMDALLKKEELMAHFSDQPFSTEEFTSFARRDRTRFNKFSRLLSAHPHEELLTQIITWRKTQATKENIIPSMIFSDQIADTIARKLPLSQKALSGIKGIGPHKANQYGLAILNLIRTHQNEQSGVEDQASLF